MNNTLKDRVIFHLANHRMIMAAVVGTTVELSDKAYKDMKSKCDEIADVIDKLKAIEVNEVVHGTKCIVKGCENMSDHGKFVGALCAPCHDFITTGRSFQSAAFRHAIDSTFQYMKNEVQP